MPDALRARFALIALLGGGALAGGLAPASSAGAAAAAPCTPHVSAIDGHPAIAYCGPATVTIRIAGRTYSFRNGLCDRSATVGGLELNVGTLVRGARDDAGRSFVSLLIAKGPSESEAFEADAGGHQLFGDSVIAQGGPLFGEGTFTSVLGAAFSGSWDCHGVIYSGP
jgi:hypothetical protein